jgi:putative flippase GtrA
VLTQFRTTKLYERVARHEPIHQFVKYALIGGVNVLLHLAIFNLLAWLGVPTLAANAVGFFVGSVNSFIWNKTWAFRDPSRDAVVRQYLRFVFFTVVGLGLHTATFRVLLHFLDDHGRIGENIALLGALPVSVLWNFTTYRRWTFNVSGPIRDSV